VAAVGLAAADDAADEEDGDECELVGGAADAAIVPRLLELARAGHVQLELSFQLHRWVVQRPGGPWVGEVGEVRALPELGTGARGAAEPGVHRGFSFVELFAGIGGFTAGLSAVGGRCLLASEINPAARALFARNWPVRPLGRCAAAAAVGHIGSGADAGWRHAREQGWQVQWQS
jgi:hypothetical protein